MNTWAFRVDAFAVGDPESTIASSLAKSTIDKGSL